MPFMWKSDKLNVRLLKESLNFELVQLGTLPQIIDYLSGCDDLCYLANVGMANMYEK